MEIVNSILAISITILAILNGITQYRQNKLKLDLQKAENERELALKKAEQTRIDDLNDRDVKNKENLEELYNKLSARTAETELVIEDFRISIEELRKEFRSHACEGSFRDQFESDIISAHNTVITGNEKLIPTKYKDIMSKWAEMISSFGLKYSRSNERKWKGIKLKIYLKDKKEALISALNSYIDTKNIFNKDEKGKRVKFSEWVIAKNIHSSTENLFDRLFINGISTTDEFKTIFMEYLLEFDSLFTNAMADFKELKDYSLMTYERKQLQEDPND